MRQLSKVVRLPKGQMCSQRQRVGMPTNPAWNTKMELQLKRTDLTDNSTIGELSINGRFECYTLEDKVRPVKIKGLTAIPAGSYEVIISFSARFKRPLPLLLNVPNFDGIRIHAGNSAKDTEGCILVGQRKSKDFIGTSRVALDALFKKLKRDTAVEKIFIHIA